MTVKPNNQSLCHTKVLYQENSILAEVLNESQGSIYIYSFKGDRKVQQQYRNFGSEERKGKGLGVCVIF